MREFDMGQWREITDGIHVVQLQPAAVNASLVVGETGVMLIDTGSSPAQGRELTRSAMELTGRAITHVVVTHWHFDHFFGLAGVLEVCPDAITIGHASMMAHMMGDDPDISPAVIRDQLGFEPSELVDVNTPIQLIKAVDLGGRRAEIFFLGEAHTDGDLFVSIPESEVIFAGDLVETSGDPAIGPDSFVKTWPKALDGVVSRAKEGAGLTFVPGHGEPVGLDFVLNQRAAISMLWGTVEDLVRKGVSVEDALADLNGERRIEWPFAAQTIADSLELLYAEAARRGVTKSNFLPLA